ncbi:DUF5317 domain-containing protein [Alicyclobacillus sp. SO9]|uniref:DUF5317 domain-containing protein n=1 Tax=Alicyclobacillus sp. SO9 TaxID=2665646 RepID=UPI0018E751E7|nr:DUF5317 domain-containing protein [Alicyclobacillus sp. SO9]QQE79909.1 DUF5317 domain-containing protein [Alicyclobacillus sp. SO9]
MVFNTAILILVAVLVAWIRGGKLENLVDVKFRFYWIIILAFAVQFMTIFIDTHYVRMIDLITYTAVLVVAFLNRKSLGILLVLIGIVMNYAVMLFNRGRMPVYIPDAEKISSSSQIHSLIAGSYGKQIAMSIHTHLNYLGDIFFVGHPYPIPTLLSAGDLVVAAGVFIFIQSSMLKSKGPQGEV